MKLIVLAQNVPYLISLGVPEANAQPILDYINSIDKKDRGKILPQIKKNPNITLDELKGFKILTPEERTQKQLEKRDVPEELLNWAKSIDPKYIDWLIKQAKSKEVEINGEDNAKIKDTLKNFDKLKKKSDFPKENKDINLYEKFSDLFELVKNLTPKTEEPVPDENDKDVIYDQDGIKVLHVTDLTKVMQFAQGTNWCVRFEHQAKTYSSQGKDFYFIYVNDNRVALMHPASQQIKDPLDHALNNYSTIKKINPVLEKLGIAPKQSEKPIDKYTPGFDFYRYNNMLTTGKEVNETMQSSQNKGSTLVQLQNKLGQEWSKEDDTRANNVILFLSDEYFDDPQIQKYAENYYFKEASDWEATGFGRSIFDDSGPYKKIPYAMRYIPSIRNKNIQFAQEQFNKNNNVYEMLGKELKVVQEVRDSYFNYWKKKIEDDPLSFETEPIPEVFLLKLKPYFIQGLIRTLKNGKSYKYVNEYTPITVPLYDKLPDELKNDPEIKAAYRQGLLEFNKSSNTAFLIIPQEFKNDPEFIEANKKAWENYVLKILPFIAAGPDRDTVRKQSVNQEGTINFPIYDKLPDEFKSRADVKAAYKKGILHYVSIYVDQFNNLPKNLQKDPEIIEKNKMGWLKYFLNNAINIKANENMNFSFYSKIPDSVKQSEYWEEILGQILVPSFKLTIDRKGYNAYLGFPEEVKKNADIVNHVENKILYLLQGTDLLSEYFEMDPELRNLPRVKKTEAANRLIWVSKMKRGDMDFYERMSSNAKEASGLDSFYKESYVERAIKMLENAKPTSSPQDIESLAVYVYAGLPTEIRTSPRIIKLLKNIIIPGWITHIRKTKSLDGVPPEILNKQAIQSLIQELKLSPAKVPAQNKPESLESLKNNVNIERGDVIDEEGLVEPRQGVAVEAKNWYAMVKTSNTNKLSKKYYPKETLEIESLEDL